MTGHVKRSLGWHISLLLIGVVSLIIAAFTTLNSLPIPIWELSVVFFFLRRNILQGVATSGMKA